MKKNSDKNTGSSAVAQKEQKEQPGTPSSFARNSRNERNAEYLKAFVEAIEQKEWVEAERYLNRYSGDTFSLSRFRELTPDQQRQFLTYTHRFIADYAAFVESAKAAEQIPLKKMHRKTHRLYCRVVSSCLPEMAVRDQIDFYSQAGDLYSRQHCHMVALDYYARALLLAESLFPPDAALCQTLIEKISCTEITWCERQGVALEASVWKSYRGVMEALDTMKHSSTLTAEPISKFIVTLQAVADELATKKAWDLVDNLYRKSAEFILYYQQSIKKEFSEALTAMHDQHDPAFTVMDEQDDAVHRFDQALQNVIKGNDSSHSRPHPLLNIMTFAQRLKQHHQWSEALTGIDFLLPALEKIPIEAVAAEKLFALEEKLEEEKAAIKAAKARDEQEGPLLPLVINYQPRWQSYREQLQTLRRAFQEGLEKSLSILTLQKEYSVGIEALLNKMIADSLSVLGEAPVDFCLLAGGSLGREALRPYSDIDIAFLVRKEEDRSHPYWQRLLKIIRFYLKTLGEPWVIDKEIILQSCGLRIDESDLPHLKGRDPQLIQTPKALATWVVAQCENQKRIDNDSFILAYGLLHTTPLFSFSSFSREKSMTGHPLCDDYKKAIIEQINLTGGYQKIGSNLFIDNEPTYKIALASMTGGKASLDFKESYLKPLILWCIDTGVEAGIFEEKTGALIGNITEILQLLEFTKKERCFHSSWLDIVKKSLECVENLYCRLQFKYDGKLTIVKPDRELPAGFIALTQEEYQLFATLQEHILIPAYESRTLLIKKAVIPDGIDLPEGIDPPRLRWEAAVATWWATEPEKRQDRVQNELYTSLQGWLLHLSFRKAPVKAYYQTFNYFRAFVPQPFPLSREESWAFRKKFREHVEAVASEGFFPPLSAQQMKEILQMIDHYPEPDGVRPSVQRETKAWRQTLERLLVAEDDPLLKKATPLRVTYYTQSVIHGGSHVERKSRALHPDLVQWLLKQKKLERYRAGYRLTPKESHANPTSGRHNVMEINTTLDGQEIRVYFKPFPEMPGIEYAAGLLARRLVGWGLPFVLLTRFHLADADCPCPLLISQTMKGENLKKVTEELLSSLLSSLNPKYYSQRVILSLALNQEDAKPENMVIAPCSDGSMRIASVDNDRSFYPGVVRDDQTQELIPLVKDITFCFRDCKKPIDPEARDEFLALDIFELLKSWLKDIKIVALEISKLFTPEEMEKFFPKQSTLGMVKQWIKGSQQSPTTSILPIFFREKLLTSLYIKLQNVQSYLRQAPKLTHLTCFERLEPLLAKYYQRLFERYPTLSPRARFHRGFRRYYGKNEKEEEVTQSTSLETLQTLCGTAVNAKELLRAHDQSVREALKELKTLHPVRKGLPKIIQQLLKREKAGLVALKALPGALRAEIINAPDFDFSRIRNSENEVDEEYQQAILDILEATKTRFFLLKLAGCTALTTMNLLRILKSSSHCLKGLDISGCIHLDALIFKELSSYSTLETLRANGLIQLTQLKIIQPLWSDSVWCGLRYLELQACSHLESLELEVPALSHLNLSGNKKLKWKALNLKKAEQLKKLVIENAPESTEERKHFFVYLRSHPRLKHLQFAEEKTVDLVFSLLEENNLENLKILAQHGISPQQRQNSRTSLMVATQKEKTEIVRWLVQRGSLVEEKDEFGCTALFYAARDGHIKTIKYLVETAKANIHAEDNDGNTALSLASLQGHLDVVRYLQSQGAIIQHKNERSQTPLMLAAEKGETGIVRWLVGQGVSIEEKDEEGWTALLYAAYYGHLGIVAFLVEVAKVDLKTEDNHGDTALTLATWQGYLEVVHYLRDRGAKIQHESIQNVHSPIAPLFDNTDQSKWSLKKLREDIQQLLIPTNTHPKLLKNKKKKTNVPLLHCPLCRVHPQEKPVEGNFLDITASLQLPGELKPRELEPIVIQHLIDPQTGSFRAIPVHTTTHVATSHRHRVIPLVFRRGLEVYALYWKENPDYPLMDYAIYSLRQHLFGHGAPPNNLAKLTVVHHRQGFCYSYPVLISTMVGNSEDNLEDYFKNNKKLLLSPRHFFESALFDAVAHPGDGVARNYQVCTLENGQHALVCIDNDQYFVSPEDPFIKGKLQMHSILFCFSEMKQVNETLLKEALQDFIRLDIKALLRYWLKAIREYEKQCLQLFNSEESKYFLQAPNTSQDRSIFHFLLPEGTLFRLGTDLCNLQAQARRALASGHIPSAIAFIESLHDLVFYKYQQELAKDDPPQIRLRRITNAAQMTLTSGQSLLVSLGKIPTLQEIEQEKKYSPKEALKELNSLGAFTAEHTEIQDQLQENPLLLVMDFERNRLSLEKQRAMLAVQLQRHYTYIAIRYCEVLDNILLEELLSRNSQLIYLELQDCPKITTRSVDIIIQYCPHLKKLKLINNENLTHIKIKPYRSRLFIQPLPLLELIYLNLSDNQNLSTVEVDLQKLEVFEIKNCRKLLKRENVTLNAPKLKELKNEGSFPPDLLTFEEDSIKLGVYLINDPLVSIYAKYLVNQKYLITISEFKEYRIFGSVFECNSQKVEASIYMPLSSHFEDKDITSRDYFSFDDPVLAKILSRVSIILICISLDSFSFYEEVKKYKWRAGHAYAGWTNAVRVFVGITHGTERKISLDEALRVVQEVNWGGGYFECSLETGEGVVDSFQGAVELGIDRQGFWKWKREKYIPSQSYLANLLLPSEQSLVSDQIIVGQEVEVRTIQGTDKSVKEDKENKIVENQSHGQLTQRVHFFEQLKKIKEKVNSKLLSADNKKRNLTLEESRALISELQNFFSDIKDIQAVFVGSQMGAVAGLLFSIKENTDFFSDSIGYVPINFYDCWVSLSIKHENININLCDMIEAEARERFMPSWLHFNAKIFVICFSLYQPSTLKEVISKWNLRLDHVCSNTFKILLGMGGPSFFAYSRLKSDTSVVPKEAAEKVAKEIGATYYELTSYTPPVLKQFMLDIAILVLTNSYLESNEKTIIDSNRRIDFSLDPGVITFLYPDIAENRYAIIQFLITKGANLLRRLDPLCNELHYAVAYSVSQTETLLKNIETLSFLLGPDGEGNTPFHYAAGFGEVRSMKLLLSAPLISKVINLPNKQGYTPLHLAAIRNMGDERFRKNEMLTLLFKSRANLYAADKRGDTPLHLVVEFSIFSAIEFLVKKGSLILQRNNAGKTALDIARNSENASIIQFLEEIISRDPDILTKNGKDYYHHRRFLLEVVFNSLQHAETTPTLNVSHYVLEDLPEAQWDAFIEDLKKQGIVKLITNEFLSEARKLQLESVIENNIRRLQGSENQPGLKYAAARFFYKRPQNYRYQEEQIAAITAQYGGDAIGAKRAVEEAIDEQKHFGWSIQP